MRINCTKMACVAIPILVFALGCTKGVKNGDSGDLVITIKGQKGEPLAQVGDTTLTVEELRADFQERQGQFKGAPNMNTDKARSDYIENQVIQEALFKEAVALNYFDRLDVKRDVKKIVIQKLMRDKLENAQNDYVPTDDQIKDHYNKNQNLYNREEAVKVAYIAVPFGADKAAAKTIATSIHKDAVATIKNSNAQEFSRLAMKHSSEIKAAHKIALETNQTDYLEKAAFEAKFGKNSFDDVKNVQEIGQISPLVVTDNGFMVVMKTGARKAINETIEEAKPKIVKRLAYENRGETYKKYVEDLRKKYNIKVFNERLAELSKGAAEEKVAKSDGVNEPVKDKKDQAQGNQ